MKLKGTLLGQPATIIFECDGFQFINIAVDVHFVRFDWDDLNTLQQEEVLRQLEAALPMPEKNFN